MIDLYGMEMSPSTRKVKWALEEASAPYTHHEINILKGETRTPEYRKINPLGTVPAIVVDGFTMCESNAIVWFVSENAVPRNAQTRAKVMQWMFFEPSIYDPLHMLFLIKLGVFPADQRDRNLERSKSQLATLESQIGEYVVDKFSPADIALGAAVAQAFAVDFDLSPYPRVREWFGRIAARPAFRRSHPDIAV
jgi:glutathione S-transferase